MRPSASLWQSSRYRLLTLLLALLFGILCAQTVGGSRWTTPNLGLSHFLTKSQLDGGTPLIRNYMLSSRCRAYVQITPARGRHAINAGGSAHSDFAKLAFESHAPNELKIVGIKIQKYLCFSRRGRLIARYNGHSRRCLFHEREDGDYIMLQSAAEPNWYVGFNRNGFSKWGFTKPAKEGGDRAGVSRTGLKRRGKKRTHRQEAKRRGKMRRHRHGPGRRGSKRRGHRVKSRPFRARDSNMCFQFTKKRTDKDRSDPRVQNTLTKQIHDPWKDSDVSKYISTVDPR